MLTLRQEFTVSSNLLVREGLIVSQRSKYDPTLDIFDVHANGTRRSVQFLDSKLGGSIDGWCLRGSSLLAYTAKGQIVSFDIEKRESLYTLFNKMPKDALITGVYPTRAADDAYIITYNNTSSLSFLIPSAEVPLSHTFKLDKFPEKCKGSIVSLWCHPSRPLCFVSYTTGVVQVWNYAGALRSALGKKSVLIPGEDSGVDQHDDDDERSDNGSVHKKIKVAASFVPVGCLMPPGGGFLTAVHTAVDSFGKLFAVVWRGEGTGGAANNYATVLYDIEFMHKLKVLVHSGESFTRLQPVSGSLSSTYAGNSNTAVRFGPIAFHPFEPFVLQCVNYADDKSGVFKTVLYALTLLDPAMAAHGEHSMGCRVDSLDVCSLSGRIITVSSTRTRTTGDSTAGTNVMIFSLAIPQPLVSRLSVPVEAYVIGDAVLKSSPKTVAPTGPAGVAGSGSGRVAQYLPAVVGISPRYQNNASKALGGVMRPVKCTYDMFRIRVSCDITNKITFLGELPSITNSSTEEASTKWFTVCPDDNLPFDGILQPTEIRTDVSAQPESDNSAWNIIVLGDTYRHAKSTTLIPGSEKISYARCAGVVRFTPATSATAPTASPTVTSNAVFGHFLSAIFWSKQSMVVNDSACSAVLFLRNNGTDLVSLPLLQDSEAIFGTSGAFGGVDLKPTTSLVCKLPKRMAAMWSPECGCPNRILMATDISTTTTDTIGPIPQDSDCCQELYLSDVGKPDFDKNTSDFICMHPGERVLQCSWQCPTKSSMGGGGALSNINSISSSNNSSVSSGLWTPIQCGGALIGTLTTSRVLILCTAPSLRVLSEVSYGSNNGKNAMAECTARCTDVPTSISWVGASLCYVCEMGSVQYLLPTQAVSVRRGSLMCRAAGITSPTESFLTGHLCSLPRGRLGAGVSLLGVLPDRLMFASNPIDTQTGSVRLSVAFRPVFPVEPLVLGLLAISRLEQAEVLNKPSLPSSIDIMGPSSISSTIAELIQTLILMYLPPKPSAVSGPSRGALPDTQASLKLAVALSEYGGLEDISAVAAGVSLSGTDFLGVDYPRYRWIPCGVKFLIALKAGLFSQAVLDLLLSRPELQELIVDPESYGSGALPHPDSAMALQTVAAARLMYACGQVDLSRRLADLGADDLFLAALLAGDEGANRQRALQSLVEAYRDNRSTKTLQILCILAETPPGTIKENALSAINIGGGNRRASMLSGVTPPLSDDPIVYQGSIAGSIEQKPVDLKALDKIKVVNSDARGGGGLGPMSTFGVLALDILEDWMGRTKLEQLGGGVEARGDASTTHSHTRGQTPVGGGIGGGMLSADGGAVGAVTRPSTWIEDVGHSKDDVVGYWRFSDAVMPGSAAFCNTAEPYCRINMLDLSKYTNPLEVFADSRDRISFVPSTSPVDPGSHHDSVKSLNDVVFSSPSTTLTTPQWGMRSVVGRGSALDVGMFHESEERNKLTFEMYIYRIEDTVGGGKGVSGGGSGEHCLARRCLGKSTTGGVSSTRTSDTPLWSICVSADGALSFTSHTNNSSSSDDSLSTPDGVVNMGPTTDEPYSTWTHIAVTVDSSDISTATNTSISLYVNGSMLAKGVIRLPPLTEDVLSPPGMLYICPNLTGWKVTELRLWAEVRSGTSIDVQRDNLLPLAEKRKRLIVYKIKGSKKFFSPLRDIIVGDAVSALIQAVDKDGDDNNNSSSIVSSGFAAPVKPLLGLAAPGKSLGVPDGGNSSSNGSGRRGSLMAPPSMDSSGGASRRGSLLAPPSTTTTAATTTGTTTNAVIKPLNVPGKPGASSSNNSSRKRGSSKVGTLPSIAGGMSFMGEEEVEGTTAATPTATTSLDNKQVEGSWDAFATTAASSATTSTPSATTVASADAGWDAFGSTFTTAATTTPTTVTATATASTERTADVRVTNLHQLQTVGITMSDIVKCIRRVFIQSTGAIASHSKGLCTTSWLPITDISSSSSSSSSVGGGGGLTTALRFAIDVDSIITFSDDDIGADGLKLVGVFANKKLSVYDITVMTTVHTERAATDPATAATDAAFSGVLVAEQSMSVPLTYWCFHNCNTILLATHASLFYWNIATTSPPSSTTTTSTAYAPAPLGSTHPVKLCDRIDNTDPTKWADRKLLDFTWGGSENMWVTTTSCLRVGPEKRSATVSQAKESCMVTIQQAGTAKGKSVVVAARGSSLGVGVGYLYIADSSGGDKLVSIDLAKLNVAPAGNQYMVTPPDDLIPLFKWDALVPMPGRNINGVYPAPGAFVGLFNNAIFVVTPSSVLLIFDSVSGRLINSTPICDSHIISCNLGRVLSDGAIVLFCLTEKGNIYRMRCIIK